MSKTANKKEKKQSRGYAGKMWDEANKMREQINARNEADKKITGRPSDYTHEFGEKICEFLESSVKGVRDLCEENDWLPTYTTIKEWANRHPVFSARYSRAKENRAHELAEETLRSALKAITETKDDNIHAMRVNALVSAYSNQIKALQWVASKANPKIYGDKPAPAEEDKDKLSNLTPEEAAVRVSAAFALAQDRAKEAKKNKK